MFEKEAEEYIKEHTFFDEEFGLTSLDITSKTAFQEGAKFGYNKGRNEAKEILKGLYFIIESRIDYKNNIGIADEMWRAKQFWSVEK